jgi:hypothetical protein
LTWQICRLGFPSASALLIFAAMFPVILSFPARVSVLHLISSPAQQLFCTDFWAAAILSVRLFSNPHEQAASGDLFFGLSFQSRYKSSVPLLCPRVRLFPWPTFSAQFFVFLVACKSVVQVTLVSRFESSSSE